MQTDHTTDSLLRPVTSFGRYSVEGILERERSNKQVPNVVGNGFGGLVSLSPYEP